MSTKDAYKQKIEAELELVKANVEVLKAKVKNATADMRISYTDEIGVVESSYAKVQSKLGELADASEEKWENLKSDIEESWDSLRKYATKSTDSIDEAKKDIE